MVLHPQLPIVTRVIVGRCSSSTRSTSRGRCCQWQAMACQRGVAAPQLITSYIHTLAEQMRGAGSATRPQQWAASCTLSAVWGIGRHRSEQCEPARLAAEPDTCPGCRGTLRRATWLIPGALMSRHRHCPRSSQWASAPARATATLPPPAATA
jgi:hypothetical protein